MKHVWRMLGLIIIVGIITGCSNESGNGNESSNVSFDDIYADIKDKLSDDLGEGFEGYAKIDLVDEDSDDPAVDIYQESIQLELDDIENGKIIGSLMNVNADEIILIEATDEEHLSSIEAALEKQLDNEYQVWEQYLPEQFEKVDNNIITTHGKFILYITYEDPEAIEDIFDSYFE